MTEGPARILALDLGDARVGLALSDPLGVTAQPLGALRRVGPRQDVARLRALVEEHRVTRVVVGHPLLLSGGAGERARGAEDLAATLREALGGIPVELWDERLTTVEAERLMLQGDVRRRRRREVVDSLAAALILQSWMEAHPRGGQDRPCS